MPMTALSSVSSVNSMQDLRGITPIQWEGTSSIPIVVLLLGHDNLDDGGAGTFFWNATDTSPDDGISVIKPNSIGTSDAGRANRVIPNSEIAAAACGLFANSSDNAPQLANVVKLAQKLGGLTVRFDAGTYQLQTATADETGSTFAVDARDTPGLFIRGM